MIMSRVSRVTEASRELIVGLQTACLLYPVSQVDFHRSLSDEKKQHFLKMDYDDKVRLESPTKIPLSLICAENCWVLFYLEPVADFEIWSMQKCLGWSKSKQIFGWPPCFRLAYFMYLERHIYFDYTAFPTQSLKMQHPISCWGEKAFLSWCAVYQSGNLWSWSVYASVIVSCYNWRWVETQHKSRN